MLIIEIKEIHLLSTIQNISISNERCILSIIFEQ